MYGGMTMKNPAIDSGEKELLEALDKGIDDLEAGKLTPHKESIAILKQRLNEYVLQNQRNG